MKTPAIPDNEATRLFELKNFEILDTPPESQFDEIVKMAAIVCHTPISLVSLVDAERQWFKAHQGIEVSETPRDVSFCGHAILGTDVFIVPDADQDFRFRDNPLVTGDANVKFYAGAPLITINKQVLGTLCVIDHKPRYLNGDQIQMMKYLANQVVSQLELRKALIAKEESHHHLEELSNAILDRDERLRYFEKLQHLSDMSASICHEVNNPLAVIMLGVEQVKRQIEKLCKGAPQEYTALNRIGESAQRISKVISGLKMYAEGVHANKNLVSVRQIIEEALVPSSDKIEALGINFCFSGDETALIYCNHSQIVQVMNNLIGNAVDAVENLSDKWITVDVSRYDLRTTRIRISDSGTGINPDVEHKIMQPFYTTKDSLKGTGLGLSIVRGIILEHNGEFRYEKFNGHTSFVIELND